MSEEKTEREFSQKQYDVLKRCSEKKDMAEWNQWCKEHPDEKILLENAYLENAYLENAHLENAYLGNAYLGNAHLGNAHLENAYLGNAHLENAHLENAHLENAYLGNAHLENAHLEGADLFGANLKGANLTRTHIESANFEGASFSASTLLRECVINHLTNLKNVVNLDSISIDSGTKELLKYNVRRLNWDKWYRQHFFGRWPMRFFWWLSDYGLSTGRILWAFLILAFSFALIYYAFGAWDYYYRGITHQPGIVKNLFADDETQVPDFLVPVRAFYFSIVTMTTLGFGDMYAHAQHSAGHLLLMIQVLLGYIILGLLVVRFSVMIRSDGPQAAKFARTKLKKLRTQRKKN